MQHNTHTQTHTHRKLNKQTLYEVVPSVADGFFFLAIANREFNGDAPKFAKQTRVTKRNRDEE